MAHTKHGQQDPQSSSDILARVGVFVTLFGIGLSTLLATVAVQERLRHLWFIILLTLSIILVLIGGAGSIYSLAIAGKLPSADKPSRRAFPSAWTRPGAITVGALTSVILIVSLLLVVFWTGGPLTTEPLPSKKESPVGGTGKDQSDSAALPSPDTLVWVHLPAFTVSGPTIFKQSLVTPAQGWPVGRSDTADVRFENGAYVVHPLSNQYTEYVAAPTSHETFLYDIVVTATASLQSGQGLWGVWCRGVDSSPTNAYMFLISHTGAVQITLTGFNDGTGWRHLDGIDVSKPVTVSARCTDTPDTPDTPVILTMAVNGREVLNYRPRKILGPGYAGITAQPFLDVDGPIAEVSFTEFRVSRYR